jgi:hypothetical protein
VFPLDLSAKKTILPLLKLYGKELYGLLAALLSLAEEPPYPLLKLT